MQRCEEARLIADKRFVCIRLPHNRPNPQYVNYNSRKVVVTTDSPNQHWFVCEDRLPSDERIVIGDLEATFGQFWSQTVVCMQAKPLIEEAGRRILEGADPDATIALLDQMLNELAEGVNA